GNENAVAGLQLAAAPTRGHHVDALGGATGPQDLPGRWCVEEAGDGGPGLLETGRGTITESMGATMHIAVVATVVVGNRLDDDFGLLCGRAVVEVNQRMTVDLLRQDGKVATDQLGIETAHEGIPAK